MLVLDPYWFIIRSRREYSYSNFLPGAKFFNDDAVARLPELLGLLPQIALRMTEHDALRATAAHGFDDRRKWDAIENLRGVTWYDPHSRKRAL
jgi:hypothetical protein